jgi:hypothetical protein
MVMTDKEEIARLKGQVAELRGQQKLTNEALARIEAKLSPPAPAPAPAKTIPGQAPQGNYGVLYCGEPTGNVTSAHGTAGITVDPKTDRRKFPDGIWRDELGQAVPHSSTAISSARPIGPPRDPKHQQDIELLDRMMARQPPGDDR